MRSRRPAALLALVAGAAQLLGACGTPAPSVVAPTAAPTSPPPSPSPTADVDALIDGLRAFAEGGTPYHLDIEGDLNLRPLTGTVTMTVDSDGRDSATAMTYELAGTEVSLGIVVVGDDAYVRVGDVPWETVDADALGDDANPLIALQRATDIRYQGSTTGADGTLHELRLLDAAAFDPQTMSSSVEDVLVRGQTFDLWVDDAGVPDHGTFRLDGTATLQGGRTVPIFIDLDYVFSEIGEPQEIEAPV